MDKYLVSFLKKVCDIPFATMVSDEDKCASKPCGIYGTCRKVGYDYRCTCNAGYTGAHCEAGKDQMKDFVGFRQKIVFQHHSRHWWMR